MSIDFDNLWSVLEGRFQLGLTLGRLGDPRIVTDLRDPKAYVEVPAGDCIVGDKKKRRTFRVQKPLLLSRFPVTNSQFELFMQQDGYRNEDHWSQTGLRWLRQSGAKEFCGVWYGGHDRPDANIRWLAVA